MTLKIGVPLVSLLFLLAYLEDKYRKFTFKRDFQSPLDDEVDEIFLAVSSFSGMEDNYVDLRRLQSSSDLEEESSGTRKAICRAVLSSPYFFDKHKVVTSNEGITDSFWQYLKVGFTKPYVYERYHILVNGEAFPEFAFSCPAWNRESKSVENFFISPEYLFRNTTTRFVFSNNGKQEMVIIAVAEEPAKMFTSSPIRDGELFDRYDLRKKKMEAVHHIEESSHVMCDLPDTKKFRMCAIVLHSEEYRNDIRFPSPTEKSDSKCSKLKLRFKYEDGGVSEDYFYEWAIKCGALNIRNREPTPFYISLGVVPDTFFVSRKVNKRILVVNEYHIPHSLL